ncbi:helix-turn-helix domain-containing protein [Tsukamurella pseudospumae]|uniref:XRE family transcriptional regulator n=1 Tax=Tsukamurella pseudospumae TaxID=239498 RepID=A0A138AEB9_9ACTN|nr:helix-turn-helix transcriptional regulator [Tsukamurella pseudospumae]KXP08719.1 XRE family transcriptional regulator [Tsukamurella pseudospumae]
MSPTQSKPPIDQTHAEFGERLRARRIELGWSQEEAAHQCGLHWSGYARVERGQQSVRIATLLQLAHGLRTTPGALLDGLPLAGNHEGSPPRG